MSTVPPTPSQHSGAAHSYRPASLLSSPSHHQQHQHHHQGHHAHSHSVSHMPISHHALHSFTNGHSHSHSISFAAMPAAAAAAAPAAHAMSSGGAASTPLLADLVRKLAAFRRGLVLERKQRQLLELQLEECQLRNESLLLQQREQDVQLLSSLELSASLEQALHKSGSGSGPVPSQVGLHERELESIFAKPKKEAEAEIKVLFAQLSSIQQYYHALEKRSLEDKVAGEASALKLSRDLKTAVDALDKSSNEARKYKTKAQELIEDLSELREENNRRNAVQAEETRALQAQIEQLQAQLATKDSLIEQTQSELEEQKAINDALAKRSSLLTEKVSTLETTVRHFTCTRILPHSTHNVSCEISIKKVLSTGEVLLCVRDRRAMTPAAAVSGVSAAASALEPVSSGLLSPVSSLDECDAEYAQDIKTVRCRAVDEERGLDALDRETEVLRAVCSELHPSTLPPLMPVHPAAPPRIDERDALFPSSGGGGDTVLLGFRPRFVLCFTGDNHRCMVFETDDAQFRDNICATLQHFVPTRKDQHTDELSRIFDSTRSTIAIASSLP